LESILVAILLIEDTKHLPCIVIHKICNQCHHCPKLHDNTLHVIALSQRQTLISWRTLCDKRYTFWILLVDVGVLVGSLASEGWENSLEKSSTTSFDRSGILCNGW